MSNPEDWKRDVLFYVDVDVAKGRKGRIGVYRGEDLSKVVGSTKKGLKLRKDISFGAGRCDEADA